jgi:hypothetical protein
MISFLNMLEAEKTAYAGYSPGLLPDNLASSSPMPGRKRRALFDRGHCLPRSWTGDAGAGPAS